MWLGGYFFASQFSELDSFRQRHCFLFLGYLLLEQTVSRRFLANNFVGTDFNLLNLQRRTVAVAVWLAVFKINFYSILDPFSLSPHSAYHVFFAHFQQLFSINFSQLSSISIHQSRLLLSRSFVLFLFSLRKRNNFMEFLINILNKFFSCSFGEKKGTSPLRVLIDLQSSKGKGSERMASWPAAEVCFPLYSETLQMVCFNAIRSHSFCIRFVIGAYHLT